jgi:hypothetical protein
MPDDLPDAWRDVLAAIVSAPVAWSSPAAIAERARLDVDDVTDRLAELDEAGYVAVWDRDDGPVLTLSALGAERIGVRLGRVKGRKNPAWLETGEPEAAEPPAMNVVEDLADAGMEWVADSGPPAELLVEAAEEIELAAKKKKKKKPPRMPKLLHPKFRRDPLPRFIITGGLPWPLIILGLRSAAVWRELPLGSDERWCRTCGGRKLRSWEYCPECDRWGFNQFRPIAPKEKKLKRKSAASSDPKHLKNLAKLRRKREREERHAKRARRPSR